MIYRDDVLAVEGICWTEGESIIRLVSAWGRRPSRPPQASLDVLVSWNTSGPGPGPQVEVIATTPTLSVEGAALLLCRRAHSAGTTGVHVGVASVAT